MSMKPPAHPSFYPQPIPLEDASMLKPRADADAPEGIREEKLLAEPTLVYARWAGYAGGRTLPTRAQERTRHIYSTSIPPERPLRLGMRVRILATTPAWYSAPEEDPETYDTYDAHIVGEVIRVTGWKGRKIILEIRNECSINTVETVKLRVPFVPEVTVQVEMGTVPHGQREAQEADLNTHAVVRARLGDDRCGGPTCWMPWRRLVGEGFLWEPTTDYTGERPGIKPGRKKIPLNHFAGWGRSAEAELESY
ncbi:hypothetical protein OH76DRAFT_1421971 [Lentinus brumalis]|uniref:Uncharacterized protein n=1 Tax=Lentinus brumalis TaxID=2498619 RepID=A0A371CT32_9APHY|nr:hypothetical protein OH76DRAFT_1421971 [Polyporus brumalis]